MPPPAQDGLTVGLFDADPFAGFGPSRFRPPDEPPAAHRLRGRCEATLCRGMRKAAPRLPGVYGMLDKRDRVIYVGKAKSLRARLLSYFRENSRDPKAGKILRHTRTLVWEQTSDEFAALLRELELIRRFRPRFNVIGQPGPRRYLYLCLGKAPAPYAYLTRDPTGKEVARYGPLVGPGRLGDAVRRLNDWFKLRDCPTTVRMAFADQPELFPDDRAPQCLRFDIGNCLGPCAGLCDRKAYSASVRAAKAFLDGRDGSVLKELTRRMAAAASELKFEQAMAARDRLALLTWLDERLTFLRSARSGGSFVYPVTGPEGGTVWYLIHRGEVQAALRAPTEAAGFAAAGAVIAKVFGEPGGGGELTYKTVDSVLLVHAWFRRYADEKAKLLTRAAALALGAPAPESVTGSASPASGRGPR
jgi:excinuclease ABC subunit C